MKRALVVAAAAVGATMSISACTAPRPGAAATVGNGRISIDDMVGKVDAVFASDTQLADNDTNRATVQRGVLGELIGDRVDDDLAAKLHLTVTQTEIDGLLNQAEQEYQFPNAAALESALLSSSQPQGYAGLESFARDAVLAGKIRSAYTGKIVVTEGQLQSDYKANLSSFATGDIAIIKVADLPTALTIDTRVAADPATFATVAESTSTDAASKAKGGDLGTVDPTKIDPSLAAAVFQTSTKAGDILGPVAVTGGFDIVQVKSITYRTYAQARSSLLAARQNPDTQASEEEYLKNRVADAQKLGVWVNPRFGVWAGAKSLGSTASAGGTVSPAPDTISIPAPTDDPGTSVTDLSGLNGLTGSGTDSGTGTDGSGTTGTP